jgi:hypothetical protein
MRAPVEHRVGAPRGAGRRAARGPRLGQRQHVPSLLSVGAVRLFDKGTELSVSPFWPPPGCNHILDVLPQEYRRA